MFSHEEYDALQRGSGLLDRSGRGRIRLTGVDRRSYLQGLLTNDILALGPGAGCYAALLTPQGRMITDMRVSELGDSLLIDLPAAAAPAVRSRLADFIFTEDVEVHDASEPLAQVGLYGPLSADVILAAAPGGEGMQDSGVARERLDSLPIHANRTWDFAGAPLHVVRSDDYGIPGFELFVERARAGALVEACRRAAAVPVSLDTVDVTRIEAGRPEFGVDMDDTTIPLEAGIEDRAISLTKGCYVGQEIIIRVLHRGHGRVARRLVGLTGRAEDGAIARGVRLHRNGRDIGVVTSAAISPRRGTPIALGYVHRDSTEPGTELSAAGEAGGSRPLTVTALPFAPAG